MRLFACISLFFISACTIHAQTHLLPSPNGKLIIKVNIDNGITYSVEKDGEEIIGPSVIGLVTNKISNNVFDANTRVSRTQNVQVLRPKWGTSARIPNDYVHLILRSSHNVTVEFRAYNDGAAWRFITDIDEDLIVFDEQAEFSFPPTSTVYYPEVKKFRTSFEPNYPPIKIEEINQKSMALTPIMVKTTEGKVVVVSESNLFEYPGMFLKKSGKNTFKGVFPKYPKRESQEWLGRMKLVKWPQLSRMVVRSTENFIAKSNGKRTYPWRVIMVGNSDLEILNNNLVYQLADYQKFEPDWVKPGKVVWDWYHNWNLQNVDFKPGINTQTYKFMIDFAASNGIEYVNIDDGWSKLWDFNRVNPDLNLGEVIAYAKEKGVGIFLWAMWNTIDKDINGNLDKFQQMGIAGLKVDFFDRSDQRMVDFVNLLADECAKRNLLLNLHGMYKPTGISRTYPNVVNIEGVLGLEYNKFSNRCTPDHNLTIPFVRNIVGPMDYTPGAMRYMKQSEFKKSWDNPHAMTTRAAQLAMYVVYHGGVQMLADSPTFYEQDEIALSFLSEVPVTWDESIPLIGKIGEVIAIARRKGEIWYIGGMAGKENQQVSFPLDFLKDKQYQMTLITDGNTANNVSKYEDIVTKNLIFSYEIKATGGFVMIIR
jgi:alpha-glucosidase